MVLLSRKGLHICNRNFIITIIIVLAAMKGFKGGAVPDVTLRPRQSGLAWIVLHRLRLFGNMEYCQRLRPRRLLSNGDLYGNSEALSGHVNPQRRLSSAIQPQKPSKHTRLRKQWLLIPLGLGITFWLYRKWTKPLPKDDLITVWPQWKVNTYYTLPLNGVSRVWGRFNSLVIPESWRETYLGWWVKFLGCDMSEVVQPDLKEYSNLSELFNRRLKPELRPIANAELVSPADGKIVGFGPIENEILEQIKGLSFKLGEFIGPDTREKLIQALRNKQTRLYYVTVYLGPKDYHGFHSPTDWTVETRRHFGGKLMGVHPNVLQRVPNVFIVNERVLLTGAWQHGFFSLTAVGAMNVGNIRIDCDKELLTNVKRHSKTKAIADKQIQNVTFQKGDRIGEFRLGSSVVLIFEAPSEFEFHIEPGKDVKYGQLLGGASL